MRDTFIPLLQFFLTTGEVTGRKKCQKMVHILQECGYDFGFDFKLAIYGAYSTGLQSQLETFVEQQYIQEKPSTTGVAGYPTSQFTPAEQSQSILEMLGHEQAPAWAELANKLNEQQTRDLEAVSTILFLRRAGTTTEQLQTKFSSLKPHLLDVYPKALALADEFTAITVN